MNRISIFAVALLGAFVAGAPAKAKSKPPQPDATRAQGEGQQQDSNAENGGIPRYQPFPHYRNFSLVEMNGKAPPTDIWINIDATGHAAGNSGCKAWNAVFVVGPDRLGPKSAPAMNEKSCAPEIAAFERAFWGFMVSGPYWDTKGDELTLKAPKGGGTMRFQRSM